MRKSRTSLKRTVYYEEDTDQLCSCGGDFWKTCSLRVANQLVCQAAIVSITPIDRGEKDPAGSGVRSLDETLAKLKDSLRHMDSNFKI